MFDHRKAGPSAPRPPRPPGSGEAPDPAGDRQAVDDARRPADDVGERVSRALVRVIPPAHGVFVGANVGEWVLGLFAGMALGAVLDLCMGNDSLIRSVAARVARHSCPLIAAVAGRLAAVFERLRLVEPGILRRLHCEASRRR